MFEITKFHTVNLIAKDWSETLNKSCDDLVSMFDSGCFCLCFPRLLGRHANPVLPLKW